ncbi:hypothetical protein F0562_022574 [Nyssa sinensis]|uniref:F-box domain-containing protein n=1 Tax=Nyssa sinensis TaxID=561372 RepID=A0A5J5BS43_9ASTE|nr:hypothetical protein F0562_022574 [Nyssa sinensis]
MKKISEVEESNLNGLPDELLFLIFHKVLDLKCLFCCSLVSKRFASIVPLIHSVSVTIPHRKSNSDHLRNSWPHQNLSKKLLDFLKYDVIAKPLHYFFSRIIALAPRQPLLVEPIYDEIKFRTACEFLKKFKELQSLQIEIPFSRRSEGDSLIKWSAEISGELEIFAILLSKSCRKMTAEENYEEEDEYDDDEVESVCPLNDVMMSRLDTAVQCLTDAWWRRHLLKLQHVFDDHGLLSDVVVTDTNKWGKIFMRGEQLIEQWNSAQWRVCTRSERLVELWNSALKPPLKEGLEDRLRVKIWDVPLLRLPLSGYAMERTSLIVIKPEKKTEKEEHDGLMEAATVFEGEEDLYTEAEK